MYAHTHSHIHSYINFKGMGDSYCVIHLKRMLGFWKSELFQQGEKSGTTSEGSAIELLFQVQDKLTHKSFF
jgi:hypothetical protein